MNKKFISIAALLCVPALLALQPRDAKISFDLASGSTKTKNFLTVVTMNLDDMSMMMNGNPSPMQPELELSTVTTTSVTITDEYKKVGGGQPLQLQRTFDSMENSDAKEMEMEMMGQSQSQNLTTESTTDLESLTVQFDWDEDAGEFVASFPNDDGDADLLEDLTEDMDFRTLLPEGEVSEGDEWKLDPTTLQHVFAAGGDLHFVPEESDEDELNMGSDTGGAADWFNEDMEGVATATFQGLAKNDDGVNLATIEIAFELNNAIDVTEEAQEALENGDMPPQVDDMSIESVDTDVALEGKGTLLWNMDEGCVYSMEISSDMELAMDMTMNISTNGMDIEIGQAFEFTGTMELTVTVE